MCVKRLNNMCRPLQPHDAGSSSKPKRIVVNRADLLVAAFVLKDPHIQGAYYATLVAIVSYTPYSINIDHHDHRYVKLP